MNPLVKGQRYQYAYAGTAQLPTTLVNALSKFDLKAGICKSWFEAGAIPTGEVCVCFPSPARHNRKQLVISVCLLCHCADGLFNRSGKNSPVLQTAKLSETPLTRPV